MHSKANNALAKKGIVFLLLFLITAIEIYADIQEYLWLLYSTKPILLALLSIWLLSSGLINRGATYRLVFLGLIASLFGDVFLMIRGIDLFIPGLLSFLTAHVLYTWSFIKTVIHARRTTSSIRWVNAYWIIGFALFLTLFLSFLLPRMLVDDEKSSLVGPVVIYALIISSMGYFASRRKNATTLESYRAVLLGSVLFIISDCILAIDKFAFSVPFPALWVMSTYVGAQFCITLGTIQQGANAASNESAY
jgi:uncharacterized membrane protein YhhN